MKDRLGKQLRDLYVGLFAIGLPCLVVWLSFAFHWMVTRFDIRDLGSALFLTAYVLAAWVLVWLVLAIGRVRGLLWLLAWLLWVAVLYASASTAGESFAHLMGGAPHEVADNRDGFIALIQNTTPVVGAFGLACHLIFHLATKPSRTA